MHDDSDDQRSIIDSDGEEYAADEDINDDIEFENNDEYKIVSLSEIESELARIEKDLAVELPFDAQIIKILLRTYNYDAEKLREDFYEHQKTDQTLEIYIFALAENKELVLDQTDSLMFNACDDECSICMMEKMCQGLVCNHMACINCWNGYIKSKVSDGIVDIKCFALGCKTTLRYDQIQLLINEEADLENYKKLSLKHYVEASRLLKWCPGKNCDRVVKLDTQIPDALQCPCGEAFCSACPGAPHAPLHCNQLKIWSKESGNVDNAVNMEWISANTRPCPACQSPIEKNGGCNFMQCKKPACMKPFCWTCMKVLPSNHANHLCNAFDPSQIMPESYDVERYKHYLQRFESHKESAKREMRLGEITERYKQRLRCDKTDLQLRFIDQAIIALRQSRSAIIYTYPFIFYLKDRNEQRIIENNLQDLEEYTEKLSYQILNLTPKFRRDDSVRATILETMTFITDRRKKLIDHCKECII